MRHDLARRVSISGWAERPRTGAMPPRPRPRPGGAASAPSRPGRPRCGRSRCARGTRGVRGAGRRGVPRPPALRLEPIQQALPDRYALDPAGHPDPVAKPRDRLRLRVGLRPEAVVHVGHQSERERGPEHAGASRSATDEPAQTARRRVRRHGASRDGEWCPGRRATRLVTMVTLGLQAHPHLAVLEVLLLPDRHRLLQGIDGEAAGLEGLAAVARTPRSSRWTPRSRGGRCDARGRCG